MHAPSSSLRTREVYDLMTSLIVPRPIAWVSTLDVGGHVNLAPFSYFTGVGSDPPMLCLSIADRADGSPKDSLRIARATGVLCVNLVEEADAARMNASAADFPPDTSEAAVLGIDTVPCASIPCVRVASARAAMECRLVGEHRYGNRVSVNLVVAEVVSFFVDDALLEPGTTYASAQEMKPIARLQGSHYARLGERFTLERPRR